MFLGANINPNLYLIPDYVQNGLVNWMLGAPVLRNQCFDGKLKAVALSPPDQIMEVRCPFLYGSI